MFVWLLLWTLIGPRGYNDTSQLGFLICVSLAEQLFKAVMCFRLSFRGFGRLNCLLRNTETSILREDGDVHLVTSLFRPQVRRGAIA